MKKSKLEQWVEQEQGKHVCHCGCGKVIVITKNHRSNGIPQFMVGHSGRKRPAKVLVLSGKEKAVWVQQEQGNHVCHCGCGGQVEVKTYHCVTGIPKYIHGHSTRLREYPSDVVRFWEKVDKKDRDSCWIWKLCKGERKYGHIRTKRPAVKGIAHRMSYLLHYGELDVNLDVLHKCDNPSCVNPHHLFVGTHADNMQDASRKGRFSKVITPEGVLEVVRLVKAGVKRAAVARKFGIVASCVTGIMNGHTFAAITGIKQGE